MHALILLLIISCVHSATVDDGLSRLLSYSGISQISANTANVVSCNAPSSGVVVNVPAYPGQWGTFERIGIYCADDSCAALLENGCILDQSWEPLRGGKPYFCPPAGLGTRFVSIMRTFESVGGVTDLGIIVFFGSKSDWNKCIYMEGPYSPMAIALWLQTGLSSIYSLSTTLTLCALLRTGSLECSDILSPGWWAAGNGPWSDWSNSMFANATGPAFSACKNATGQNSVFLRPSTMMCPSASGGRNSSCSSPDTLSSFSVSSCGLSHYLSDTIQDAYRDASYILGVRLSDGISIGHAVGNDTFNSMEDTQNTSSAQQGLYLTGPVSVSNPFVPPLLRCLSAPGLRGFVGMLANGSFFYEPEIRSNPPLASNVASTSRSLTSKQAGFTAVPMLWSGAFFECTDHWAPRAGPFLPFAFSGAGSVNTAWLPGSRCNRNERGNMIGVRNDGSIASSSTNGYQATILPRSPIALPLLVSLPSDDIICASSGTLAAYRSDSNNVPFTYGLRCLGPKANALVTSFNAVGGSDYFDFQRVPPIFSLSRKGLMAFINYSSWVPAPATGNPSVFFTGSIDPSVKTGGAITGVTALTLQPVFASFACFAFDLTVNISFNCYGFDIPATFADRPPSDRSVSTVLLASTNTTVCATLNVTGWIWCFSNDVSSLNASATSQSLPFTTPPGADPSRAIMIQVNATALVASESLVCALLDGIHPNVACFGSSGDPVVRSAGGFAAMSYFITSRGGTRYNLDAISISIGNSHGCIIDSGSTMYCWTNTSSSLAAVAAANAANSTYFSTVAAGGSSVCAVNSSSQLNCWGPLSSYVINGQLPRPITSLNASNVPTSSQLLSTSIAAGRLIMVDAAFGNDTACSAVLRSNMSFISAQSASCATMSRAIALSATIFMSKSSLTICIEGTVSSGPLFLPNLQASLLLITGCQSIFSGVESVIEFQGNCTPACFVAPVSSSASLIISYLTVAPSTQSSLPCMNVFLVQLALSSLLNVTLSNWTCSDSLISFQFDSGVAYRRNSDFNLPLSQLLYSPTTMPAAAIEMEAVNIAILNCNTSIGISSSLATGVHFGGLTATNSTFSSLLFIDQAWYARIEDISVSNTSSFAVKLPPRWSNLSLCGIAVRLNNVAMADVKNLVATHIRGYSGGGICVTDQASWGVPANHPTPTRIAVRGLTVDSCYLLGGGCGADVLVPSSPSSIISFDQVFVAASSVLNDGAAIRARYASRVSISNALCSNNQASKNGGCLALYYYNVAILGGIFSRSVSSGGDGGGIYLESTPSSFVSISMARCVDCSSIGTIGGGFLSAIGSATVTMREISCDACSASQASGGCMSVRLPLLPLSGGRLDISSIQVSNSSAAKNGGGISVFVGMNPGEVFDATATSLLITDSSAGACANVSSCTASTVRGGGGIAFTCGAPPAHVGQLKSVDGNGFLNGVALPSIYIGNASLINNMALQGHGGHILLGRGSNASCQPVATLVGVHLLGGSAVESGGGLYADSSLIEIQRGIIENNTAGVDGGGIFGRDSTLFSPNIVISNNAAGRYGGGAALSSCIMMGLRLMDSVQISQLRPSATPTSTQTPTGTTTNTASVSRSSSPSPSRSRLSSLSSTSSLSPSTSATPSCSSSLSPSPRPSPLSTTLLGINIFSNTATVCGGGVYLSSCNSVLGGVVISSNTASDGGGIFVTGSSQLSMCASLVFNNRASSNASALSSQGRGSAAALLEPSSFGGGLSVLDPEEDIHICDAMACETFLNMYGGLTGVSSLPRLGFAATLGVLVGQATTAERLFSGAGTLLREFLPSSPSTVAQEPSSTYAVALQNLSAAVLLYGDSEGLMCAWSANSATGPGGDISLRSARSPTTVARSFPPLFFVANSLLYASFSDSAGGSIWADTMPISLSALSIVASSSGQTQLCCSGPLPLENCNRSSSSSAFDGNFGFYSVAASAGFGGAIALQNSLYAEMINISATSTSSRYGGTLWILPYDSSYQASTLRGQAQLSSPPNISASSFVALSAYAQIVADGGTAVAAATSLLDGRILISNLSSFNSAAASSGGTIFIAGASPPPCLMCQGTDTSSLTDASQGYGSYIASLPLRVDIMSTYPTQADGNISLVSLVAAPAPIALLRLVDVFNQTASSDDTTECTCTVLSGAGEALALMYSPVYTAKAGIVRISPFGISSAPGSFGYMKVSCVVSYAGIRYTLSRDVASIGTSKIVLLLKAISVPHPPGATADLCGIASSNQTVQLDHPVLFPSVPGAAVMPEWMAVIEMRDEALNLISPPLPLRCALAIASALDSTGGITRATLLTEDVFASSLMLYNSSAGVYVAINAPQGSSISISASCTWITGTFIDSRTRLEVEMARLELAWVLAALPPPSGVYSLLDLNATDCISSPLFDSACVTSATSASSSYRSTNGTALPLCMLTLHGVDFEADGVAPESYGSLTGALNMPAAFSLNASTSVTAANATTVSISGMGFRAAVTLRGITLILLMQSSPLLSAWNTSIVPATHLSSLLPASLPSASGGATLLPLSPSPSIALVASHSQSPLPYLYEEGTGSCSASLLLTDPRIPPDAALVGTFAAAMFEGAATFPSVGTYRLPFGLVQGASIVSTCSLPASGITLRSPPLPIQVTSLLGSVQVPLPPLMLPSSSAYLLAAPKLPLVYSLKLERSGIPDAAPEARLSDIMIRNVISSSCTLQCQDGAGSPCSLVGTTRAGTETLSTGSVDPMHPYVGLYFPQFGLTGSGTSSTWPSVFCVKAQCTWIDSQVFESDASCTSFPTTQISWCTDTTSGAAAAAGVNASCPGGPWSAIPPIIIFNEPLKTFGAMITVGPELPLLSSSSTATSNVSTSWEMLNVQPSEITCGLSSYSTSDGSPLLFSGSSLVNVDATTSLAAYSDIALALTAAQIRAMRSGANEMVASFTASCYVNSIPFGDTGPLNVSLPLIRVVWAPAPQSIAAPISSSYPAPLSPTVGVTLISKHNQSLVLPAKGRCSVCVFILCDPPASITEGAAAGSPAFNTTAAAVGGLSNVCTSPESATSCISPPTVRLFGTSTVTLDTAGLATFPNLALFSSLGSTVTLLAMCARDFGGVVDPSYVNVTTIHSGVDWAPRCLSNLSPLTLTDIIFQLCLQVTQRIISPDGQWAWIASPLGSGQVVPAGTVISAPDFSATSCTLVLTDVTLNPQEGDTPVSYTAASTYANLRPDASGFINITVSFAGSVGRRAALQPTCTVADRVFLGPTHFTTLQLVDIELVSGFPSIWLPSDGNALLAISPSPSVRLRGQDGALVSMTGVLCSILIGGAPAGCNGLPPSVPSPSILNAPPGGYYNNPYMPSSYPIVLDGIYIDGGFGDTIPINVSCKRRNKDPAVPLQAKIRMGHPQTIWLQQPPPSISPGTLFNASVLLYDDLSPAATDFLQWGGGTAPDGLYNETHNIFQLDTISSCSLVPSMVTDAYGTVLSTANVSLALANPQKAYLVTLAGVTVQGSTAIASRGVVTYPSAAITARLGSIISGYILCSISSIVYPSLLPWTVSMTTCPPGSAPYGQDGFSCVNCGNGFYADGGPGTTSCTQCPPIGVACTSGHLTLLANFYRAIPGPTVDQNTELHACLSDGACFVNTSTTNRSSAATYHCNLGYEGPLCNICTERYALVNRECVACPPAAFNWFFVSLLPLLLLSFGFWAAQRQVKEDSPLAPMIRICLSYFQVMGVLLGTFVSQGTALFRSIFGFTSAAGSSPMTLSPIACSLRLSFYDRFAITISLPLILSLSTLLALWVLSFQCLKRWGGRRNAAAPPTQGSSSQHSESPPGGTLANSCCSCMQLAFLRIFRAFTDPAVLGPTVFVLNVTFPTTMSSAFSTFDCIATPIAGVYYLTQDYTIVCYTPLHSLIRGIAVLVIAVAGIGIPAFFSYVLYRRRERLATLPVYSSLGFLFAGYDQTQGYFFESIVMLRKAGVIMIGNLIKDAFLQLVACAVLLAVAMFILVTLRPYSLRFFEFLDALMLMVLLVTVVATTIYLQAKSRKEICNGIPPSVVPSGSTTSCGEITQKLISTDFYVTLTLVGMHFIFVGFLLTLFIRLSCVRSLRIKLQGQLELASDSNDAQVAVDALCRIEASAPRHIGGRVSLAMGSVTTSIVAKLRRSSLVATMTGAAVDAASEIKVTSPMRKDQQKKEGAVAAMPRTSIITLAAKMYYAKKVTEAQRCRKEEYLKPSFLDKVRGIRFCAVCLHRLAYSILCTLYRLTLCSMDLVLHKVCEASEDFTQRLTFSSFAAEIEGKAPPPKPSLQKVNSFRRLISFRPLSKKEVDPSSRHLDSPLLIPAHAALHQQPTLRSTFPPTSRLPTAATLDKNMQPSNTFESENPLATRDWGHEASPALTTPPPSSSTASEDVETDEWGSSWEDDASSQLSPTSESPSAEPATDAIATDDTWGDGFDEEEESK